MTSGRKNAGKTQVLKVAKRAQRPGGNDAWRLGSRRWPPSCATPSTGDLMMPAVTDTYEGVVVITTPPNPLPAEGHEARRDAELAQKVSVNYLDDPT